MSTQRRIETQRSQRSRRRQKPVLVYSAISAISAFMTVSACSKSAGDQGVTLAVFMPSLHLNLAADYERVGELTLARVHATEAAEASRALPASPLGDLTRDAIARINRRLG